jgi:putative endonuclease
MQPSHILWEHLGSAEAGHSLLCPMEPSEPRHGAPARRWSSRPKRVYTPTTAMPVFSRCIFRIVHWTARRDLREQWDDARVQGADRRHEAPNAGVRAETCAYWYLLRRGYIFVARNYMPGEIKGEVDLLGCDGKTLAFVEVRTRTVRDDLSALPELSVTTDKRRAVIRTAQRFLTEPHVRDCPCCFDVLAIDNRPGLSPELRFDKDAFSPQM